MMKHQKKAIVISYMNLLMGMVVNVFITPMLIVMLGDVDYSLYKVMHSFAGPLSMFHLGISTVVTRSIVKCSSSEEYSEKDKRNTMALALIASVLMALFVIAIAVVMYFLIPELYGDTYSVDSLKTGQHIFIMFVVGTVMHMLTDVFSGCILGHERYVVSAAIPLVKTISKCILLIVLLKLNASVHFVVAVDMVLAVAAFLFSAIYAIAVLGEVPRLFSFDRHQLMEIMSFGLAILLQAFVNQVNNNVDTMILGVYVSEKAIITMYASALTIYSIYNSLISVISHYFLPKATKLITNNASGRELTEFVIKPGRFQAAIAVACILGFALFGRNFITIWIGTRYMDAYGVILMLMIPVTIPLVQNAMISVLDAAMKRLVRSIVLVVIAVLNVLVSVVLVRCIGFWGAAIGTMFSLILGHGILMNIYYAREFGVEVFRMFAGIFRGVLPAGIVAAMICLPLAFFLPDTRMLFVLKCTSFVAIYFLCLILFGFNQREKMLVVDFIRNLYKKVKAR